jgi:type IV secretory pathway TrbL component
MSIFYQIIYLILIVDIVVILVAGIELLKHYLRKKQIYLPIVFLNVVLYYIFGLFIVILSARIGPYIIEHFTSYKIDKPYSMTASDATYYTLQALIAIALGSFAKNK